LSLKLKTPVGSGSGVSGNILQEKRSPYYNPYRGSVVEQEYPHIPAEQLKRFRPLVPRNVSSTEFHRIRVRQAQSLPVAISIHNPVTSSAWYMTLDIVDSKGNIQRPFNKLPINQGTNQKSYSSSLSLSPGLYSFSLVFSTVAAIPSSNPGVWDGTISIGGVNYQYSGLGNPNYGGGAYNNTFNVVAPITPPPVVTPPPPVVTPPTPPPSGTPPSGTPPSVTIPPTTTPPSTTPTPTPPTTPVYTSYYVAIGVIVAVVVALASVLAIRRRS